MAPICHPFTYSYASTRLSIRWVPEPPFENTDTLVLIVGEWYVDLRIDKQSGGLDWAIAGQCLQQNTDPRSLVFTHEIDSNNNFNVSDPCPFVPLPNGDDLETGSMCRPDLPGHPVTDYEEVWRYLPTGQSEEGLGHNIAWILESDEDELREGQGKITKTFLGRIGSRYLALQQVQTHSRVHGSWNVNIMGGDLNARSEEWIGDRWKEKHVLINGCNELPSMGKDFDMHNQASWHVGRRVTFRGCQYTVRAFEQAEITARGTRL
ncbi:uncharacterized protein N7477_008606 [Penicillium maclennaniae]|uniref:uncharacterized protein n=1 Tax=Penicillium maclennaniae TaxID=1343394 RepID=UPI0025405CFD|nr:uncharacterized protein N7477_008606 [Penicillium maclennaniae]KAJ5666158.1 hypothetical protein N7477_008606 [Penicillium maclennaniae]